MKVKDIMTKSVASLNPEDTVEHVAQLMKEHNIGSLPVCNGEKVIGMITDRDITLRSTAEGENVQKQTVRDIMTSNPVVISPEIDAKEASRIMSERQIRRLPVVENNNLVGVVSLGDISVEPNLYNSAGKALTNISEPSTPNI
ncbi:CBS domain-containing protein [Clostridium tetanomorphum]|uniref:CBS domain-containing protein n=1 Tax=Clostridium tetanomorphum TaxID=1553 RepID=A0A923EA53_CLOTT|nr:CBS domain-containing protein [Clostridium tetanomorphum]MBC2399437.1 CBS domain-containing protein [Clostridium tetanomorphum]NRZ99366.1 CBS domain-containing protein [Clostridium tetanomorphum]